MVGLAAIHPDRVGVGHRELSNCEVARLIIGDRDAADKVRQRFAHDRDEDIQSRVEPIGRLNAWRLQCGLCHGMVLLSEHKSDGISRICVLKENSVHLQGSDQSRESIHTTNSGSYFRIPIPPTVT